MTNSPCPTPCPPVPPMVPSHQVSTGLLRYRWTLKSIATVAGSGTFLNQIGEPCSSTISGPHSPVPDAGVKRRYPGTVPPAGVVMVTSGMVRRSGRDRYLAGVAVGAAGVAVVDLSGASAYPTPPPARASAAPPAPSSTVLREVTAQPCPAIPKIYLGARSEFAESAL